MRIIMDIKQQLTEKRDAYIETYGLDPNILFISNNLLSDLDQMVGGENLYNASPKHLWGADVIVVLSDDIIKFAEHTDVRKAAIIFKEDRGWGEYPVRKFKTSIGGGKSGSELIKSKTTEHDPISFTGEELDIYLMQN